MPQAPLHRIMTRLVVLSVRVSQSMDSLVLMAAIRLGSTRCVLPTTWRDSPPLLCICRYQSDDQGDNSVWMLAGRRLEDIYVTGCDSGVELRIKKHHCLIGIIWVIIVFESSLKLLC